MWGTLKPRAQTRATVLLDLPTLTIPYFLPPRFESPETLKLYSTFGPAHYREWPTLPTVRHRS